MNTHGVRQLLLLLAALAAMVAFPLHRLSLAAQPPTSDLRVTKTVSPPSGVQTSSANITYTITVTNDGASPAMNVMLEDTLPDGLINISVSACPIRQCQFGPGDHTVTCLLGTIPPGGTETVRIVVHPVTTGTKTNNVTVGDQRATVSSDINEVGITDLEVTVTDAPDPVVINGEFTYTASVRNLQDDDAQDVILTDLLPSGLQFISATGCLPGSSLGAALRCRLGVLLPGAAATIVNIRVRPTTIGFFYNTVGVGASTADPNVTNNSATARTVVHPAAACLATATKGKG